MDQTVIKITSNLLLCIVISDHYFIQSIHKILNKRFSQQYYFHLGRQQQNRKNLVSLPPPFWTPLALSLPQCLVSPSGLFAAFGANFVIMNEKYLLSKNYRIQYSVLFETNKTYSM